MLEYSPLQRKKAVAGRRTQQAASSARNQLGGCPSFRQRASYLHHCISANKPRSKPQALRQHPAVRGGRAYAAS